MKIPPRLSVGRQSRKLSIAYKGKPLYAEAKNYIRNLAKKTELYYIKVDNGGVCGTDTTGNPIPVDTLGKWLFGLPQYKGHIIFDLHQQQDDDIVCYIPDDCPHQILDMLIR